MSTIGDRSYGGLFTSHEAFVLLSSIDEQLETLAASLDKKDKEEINTKLSSYFELFQKCIGAIETSKNPIAKAKSAEFLARIQSNYEKVAASLRGRCWSLGVYVLGHYPCASDETLGIVKKGWSAEVSAHAKLADEAAKRFK